MPQTTASALDNRVVTFVDIDNDFDCAICLQVADNPVRCSGLCAGIFCDGCMRRALTHNNSCPSCKKSNITAPKDVVLRNMIMKHQVYCPNKSNSWTMIKTKKAASNQKCTWIGKYDELSSHIKHCGFEMVSCVHEGCERKMERYKLIDHLQACAHRTEQCKHCGGIMTASAMMKHVEKCPAIPVYCECGFEGAGRSSLMIHQEENCLHYFFMHEHLTTTEPRPSHLKWRITNIAAKLEESKVKMKRYFSPYFMVFKSFIYKQKLMAMILD